MLKLDLKPPPKALLQFAWIATVGFPLLGVLLWWRFGVAAGVLWCFVALGVIQCLAALFQLLGVIRPVYVGMMVIALPIGFVISHALLGAIYFLMFAPMALLFRLRRKDPLDRAWNPSAGSYWHHSRRQRPPASYLRLY